MSRCSNGLSLGLKFDECYYIHKGVFRGLWSRGILGVSYRKLKAMGIKVSPGTWTSYVKDVRIILFEKLERERRDPANKYLLAQWV